MGQRKAKRQPEEDAGAPEWMVTFSDCMTLLLTFFVLLLSFSSFDDKSDFKKRLSFLARGFSSIGHTEVDEKEAIISPRVIQHKEEIDKGSEKPTLEDGNRNGLKKHTELLNYHNKKVFLISSKNIFMGKGSIISLKGRKTLSAVALFLKEVPDRVVISENRPGNDAGDGYSGLNRAWAVINYLTKKKGVDKAKLNISAGSMISSAKGGKKTRRQKSGPRQLEIVLLERSVYQ